MRPFSPAPIRRALAVALATTAWAVVVAGTPASADPTVVAHDPSNSAVVTRLSISDGRGWLTLHARSTDAVGLEVRVPAGNGSWSGKEDVYMPEQDAHCHLQSGPDLHYLCSPSPGETQFPSGGFAVSIPVTRTGGVEGLTGTVWAFGATSVGYDDTFPVLDGTHYRSTAEVRAAPLTRDEEESEVGAASKRDEEESEGRATVSMTTTIVPKEAITTLDVALPEGKWRIVGSNVANHGVRCRVLGSETDSATLHCRPADASASGFPAGRYQLVLDLEFCGDPEDQFSDVSLTQSGRLPEVQDTFAWIER
jgi:hypothetical protein